MEQRNGTVTKEALAKQGELLFERFMASKGGREYKVEVLGIEVVRAPSQGSSLIVLKLHSLEMGSMPKAPSYAAFMLLHEDGLPAELLFPIGYLCIESLEGVNTFIEAVQTTVTFDEAEGMNGIGNV